MNVLNNTVRKEIIELLLDENRSDLSFYTVLVLGIKVHEIKIIDSALTALLKYPFLSKQDLIHNNQLVEDDMQTILGGFDNFVQLTGIEPKSFDQWLREKPDGKSVVISRTIYERYLYTIENFVGTNSGVLAERSSLCRIRTRKIISGQYPVFTVQAFSNTNRYRSPKSRCDVLSIEWV